MSTTPTLTSSASSRRAASTRIPIEATQGSRKNANGKGADEGSEQKKLVDDDDDEKVLKRKESTDSPSKVKKTVLNGDVTFSNANKRLRKSSALDPDDIGDPDFDDDDDADDSIKANDSNHLEKKGFKKEAKPQQTASDAAMNRLRKWSQASTKSTGAGSGATKTGKRAKDIDSGLEKVEKKQPSGSIPKRSIPQKESQSSLLANIKPAPPPPSMLSQSTTAVTSAKTNSAQTRKQQPPQNFSKKLSPSDPSSFTPSLPSERQGQTRQMNAPATSLDSTKVKSGQVFPTGPHMQVKVPSQGFSLSSFGLNFSRKNRAMDSLAQVCETLSKNQPNLFSDDQVYSVDLSGSFFSRNDDNGAAYDFFDTNSQGEIILPPRLPMFPEDFPPGMRDHTLQWWGIQDPALGDGKFRPTPRVKDPRGERPRSQYNSSQVSAAAFSSAPSTTAPNQVKLPTEHAKQASPPRSLARDPMYEKSSLSPNFNAQQIVEAPVLEEPRDSNRRPTAKVVANEACDKKDRAPVGGPSSPGWSGVPVGLKRGERPVDSNRERLDFDARPFSGPHHQQRNDRFQQEQQRIDKNLTQRQQKDVYFPLPQERNGGLLSQRSDRDDRFSNQHARNDRSQPQEQHHPRNDRNFSQLTEQGIDKNFSQQRNEWGYSQQQFDRPLPQYRNGKPPPQQQQYNEINAPQQRNDSRQQTRRDERSSAMPQQRSDRYFPEHQHPRDGRSFAERPR